MKKALLGLFMGLVVLVNIAWEAEEEAKKYYISFKINGVEKSFYSTEDYGIQETDNFRWYSSWSASDDEDADSIAIWFPSSVYSGAVYTESSYSSTGFSILLDADGELYTLYDSPDFTLTVDQWGEKGDVVSGTFSGTFVDSSAPDAVITDGVFEAVITHYIDDIK